MTEQITHGMRHVANGIVNWFLVEDGRELALYDAGSPRSSAGADTIRELGHRRHRDGGDDRSAERL